MLCQFLDGFSPEAFKVTGLTGLGTVPAVDLKHIFTGSIKRLNGCHSVFVRERHESSSGCQRTAGLRWAHENHESAREETSRAGPVAR